MSSVIRECSDSNYLTTRDQILVTQELLMSIPSCWLANTVNYTTPTRWCWRNLYTKDNKNFLHTEIIEQVT